MSKKKWYKRTHQFTPYTKADGQAVSDEFDAIQASFERIPEMRDDGKGFAVSPLIPEPTDPNHPVPFKMLTETEASVNNARDDVIAKAKQVAQNTQTVETNTQTAINQANSATQSATSAAASSQSADESEGWARKWASNPIDEPVSGDKYSAYHYASKAAISAQNLSTAEQSAKTNANIAAQKAEEAKISADRAKSIADGEVEYGKVLNVPRASGTQAGIVQLTDDTGIDSDKLGLSARAGKKLAQMIAVVQLALNNYIPNNKKSSAVNSNSNDTLATSTAVKSANDNANTRVSKSGDTMGGNLVIDSQSNAWSGIALKNKQGKYLVYEVTPDSEPYFGSMIYRDGAGHNINHLRLPKRDGEIALKEDVDGKVSKSGGTMTGNLTVPNLIVNDPTNNNNFVQIGDDTKLIDVDMGHTVGLQATDNANDAYIAYGATKKRFGFDGANFKADSGIAAQWYQADAKGHGSFGAQWRDKTAPYVVNNPNANGSNIYFPFLKGFNSNGSLYGTAFSFGYMTPGHIDQFGSGVIHLIEDNGAEKMWWFLHDGTLQGADFATNDGKRLTKTHQTNYAYVETTASNNVWGGLRINRNGDYMLIESNVSGGFDFIRRNNDGSNVYALSAPTKNGTLALTSEVVSDIRFGSQIYRTETDNIPTGGYILEGTRVQGGTRTLVYKTIQKLVNGNWYTVSG